MANTYTLINSTSLSTTAASVTFSAIPATFDDLLIVHSARSDRSAQSDFLQVRINGLSTSIYSDTVLYANAGGGSIISTRGSNVAQLYAPRFSINGNTTTSNTFSSGEIYIPSYRVSQNKPIGMYAVTEDNITEAYASVAAGLIRETGAITSIVLNLITGPNFMSGSTFWLYGIKNS